MATLTALSLLAGSAALILGANAAKGIENAVPAAINSYEAPAAEPPATATVVAPPPLPEREPQATATIVAPPPLPERKPQATATIVAPPPLPEPALAPEPAVKPPAMAGGAIGRPKWGVISSTVVAPQDTTLGATVSNALGIREDPRALNDQIILVERQLETANFSGFVLKKKIADTLLKYQRVRKIFAEKFAESKNQELTSADYLKKLNNQGNQNQEGKKALNKIISDNSKSQAERDDAKKKLAEMGQAKEVDETTLGKWRQAYTDATARKIEADDEKTDAERDKNKYFAELTDLRTKVDEQEKTVKELLVKRNALLTRYQAVLLQKKKKEPQPVDMQARNDRYAKSITAKNVAEENLRRFYSNTWLPLEGQPSQATYQGQFNSLQTIWRNAKAEVELAQAALTAPSQVSTTDAEAEFAAFASDVVDLTRNAIDRNGNIKNDFIWADASMRGYPSAVKTLKEYAVKPKLRIAANVYYEIANMDTAALVRNTPRFLDYFKKLKGTIGVRSERERPSSFSGQSDVTNVVLRKFVSQVLELAANQVRLYPRPADIDQNDPQAVLYAQLREKTNEFVDKQIFLLNKMFKVIKTARKTIKLSGVEGKNLLDLEEKARELYPIGNGVPPMGMCQRRFKPSTFEALSTGIFKGKKILEEVLEDPTLKDEFLDAIGFIKVSNLIEAQEYARTRGATQATAIKLIKEAAFEEYTKNAERLAFENPTGQSYVRIGGDWAYLNAMNGIGPLSKNPLNITLPVPGGGNLIPNPRRAQELRDEANLHQFVPGVFLEAGRLQPDGTRVKSIEPLVNFRDACETDGNVGQGSEQTSRILDILDRIASMEISPKQESNPLLTMIKKLEEKKKIDLTRPDQAEPQSSLAQHGFPNGVDNWAVMKVADEPKLNFVQTFLTFRSSKFRSIPYNDTTVYGGKTVNTRELYSKLALAEIEKMPSFDSRSKDDKESFPSDADWGRLSDDFHLNFVIYKDNKGTGVTDRSHATRPNAPVYNVFKAKNDRYYPIKMNAGPVAAPGQPPGVNGPQFAQFNRGILGGAIDGVSFPVATFEPEEKTGEFLQRTVGKPIGTAASAAASGIATAASAAASGIATAASYAKTTFDAWIDSFTQISESTQVSAEIQKKIQLLIEENKQTKKFTVTKFGIQAVGYKPKNKLEIETFDQNAKTLIEYYLMNNRFELRKHETLFEIPDKTMKYVLEVCGAIMEVIIDDNNLPTFILHTNNTPGFIVYDNCRVVGGATGYYSLLIWSIYTFDLINLTCIGKKLANKTLLLNLFDHPMVRKDKLHPFEFKRKIQPAKTYDVGETPLYSFSSIPAEYDDIMIVMPDVMMFLFRRAFSAPSGFTPFNIGCKKLLPGTVIDNIPGWDKKANKAVFRGSLTSCDVPIESNIRFRAHLLSLAFPKHIDAVVNNAYEGLIYGDRSIKISNIRDWGSKTKRINPNQQQSGYKYILELEGFASAWRIVQEMFYSSLLLVPDSKFSDVLRSIIKPWVHYVPVKQDLSDLVSKIEWCNTHDKEVRMMITQMNCLANDTVTFENTIRFSGEVFNGTHDATFESEIKTRDYISVEPVRFVFADNVIPPTNSSGTITEILYPNKGEAPIVRSISYYDANAAVEEAGSNPFAAAPSARPAVRSSAQPARQIVADRAKTSNAAVEEAGLNPFAAAPSARPAVRSSAQPARQIVADRAKTSNAAGSALAEALSTSKARTRLDSSIRCREVIQQTMALLPPSEQGKSFSQLDQRYKNIVKTAAENEGFSSADIELCVASDVFPKPAAPIQRPARAVPSPRAPEVPVGDRVHERLGQLQDTKKPPPGDLLPLLPPGQSVQEANAASIRRMFPEGGRRKTTSWRRSKPARYTRRKF
jgi:hypothetical protein